ncbi:integrase core domain protein [Rhizoctonia solani]|uniref:Integrase core domain protein n=1 Tax=Rhizoctonia solani TaxID=456999 RepID=A0A8H8T1R4_9AGAM|nr:integrase core domain protein [Rhizoctonia solani]QRW26084.1 integrase core domain protein [Rhizoctonia solani]
MADNTASTSTNTGISGLHRIPSLRGTENYNVWRIQMEDILTDLDLFAHVNGTKQRPNKTINVKLTGRKDANNKDLPDLEVGNENPEYTSWAKDDRKALSNIRLRVDGHVLTHIRSCEYSANAWQILEATYQVQGTVGLIDLRRKFFSHRMTDGEDVEEHIQRMRGWFQQINSISPNSCTEIDWITTLIASLPDSWDSFTQSVSFQFDSADTTKLTTQISDLRSRVLAEAHRRNTRSNEGKAFFSTNKPLFNRTVRTNSGHKGPDKSKSKCNNCGKIGHWAAECRGPGGGAYKHSQNNKGNQTNRKFNSPNRPRNNNARAHIAVANNDTNDYAFSNFENIPEGLRKAANEWIADSGTTTHIANNRNSFSDYSKTSGYVTGVTGKEPILGRGTVELECLINNDTNEYRTIRLTNVAHVPSSPANLISLSLVTDKGYRVSMDRDQLVIHGTNNEVITYGSKLRDRDQGSLWKINAKAVSKTTAKQKAQNVPTELALVKQTGRTWLDWHRVLGHIGPQALQRIKNTGAVSGMEIAEDKDGLNFECESCIQAKAHTRPFPKESTTKTNKIGELVVTNVWGPARTPSIGRYKYYVSFTDVATRFTRLGFLRHKDKTLNEYKLFEAMLNTQKNKKIKRVQFDNGGEFVNKEWEEHAAQKGTVLETTAPYSSQQNGIAERLNRTLTDKARAMLLESAAPKFLWNEAIAYACYLKNRVPTQVHGKFWKTPFEAFWGNKPDVSVLRPWGTKCYVLDQGENRSKLDPKTFTATFVGISDAQEEVDDSTDWGELEDARTGGEHVVRKTEKNELKIESEPESIKEEVKVEPTSSNSSTEPVRQPALHKPTTSRSRSAMRPNLSATAAESLKRINSLTTGSYDGEHGKLEINVDDTSPSEISDIFTGSSDANSSDSKINYSYDLPTDDTSTLLSAPSIPSEYAYALETPTTPKSTSTINDRLVKRFSHLRLSDATPTEPDSPLASTGDLEQPWSLAAITKAADNPTVEEALAGPQALEWWKAMQNEVSTFDKLDTTELTELPYERKAMGNKWVLTLKRDENGEPVRYKARLVVQGFSQQPGIDFDKTFAPVLDVNAAYLHAPIEEDLYMRQIPYFNDGTDRVLKLKRSIYGLKQAGQMWNKFYDTKLKTIGYKPCLTNTCVYQRIQELNGEQYVSIIATHVDDSIVITSTNHTDFAISELLNIFNMRDLGPIRHFLGITFKRDRKQGIMHLNQTAYINSLAEFAGLKDAYPADTPLSPSVQLTRFEGTKPKFNYGTYIGKLLYAALCTRPDIAFAVAHLAQFTSCYGPAHVTQIKRVIRYLLGTPTLGLTYRRSAEDFGEIGYSDADWGSNLIDRKSVSGHVFMLGGAAISWSAKKQATVALSTMEAEYMSLAHTCTQALWLRQFFEELHLYADAPTLILSNNIAALTLSVESQYHGRSKHIDIRHHFMRDIIEQRKVSTLYVPTHENLANAFTKALPAPQFRYLMRSIMGEITETSIEDEVD